MTTKIEADPRGRSLISVECRENSLPCNHAGPCIMNYEGLAEKSIIPYGLSRMIERGSTGGGWRLLLSFLYKNCDCAKDLRVAFGTSDRRSSSLGPTTLQNDSAEESHIREAATLNARHMSLRWAMKMLDCTKIWESSRVKSRRTLDQLRLVKISRQSSVALSRDENNPYDFGVRFYKCASSALRAVDIIPLYVGLIILNFELSHWGRLDQ